MGSPNRLLFSRPWIRWAVILGGWTLLSVFFAPEIYLYFLYKGDNIPLAQTLALTAANTGIAAAFAPAIVWLTRRFPFGRGTWPRSLVVHVPACLVFSVGHSLLYAALCYASPVFHILFLRFHPNLISYWAIVGVAEAIRYFEKYQERERQLAQAQLELLKARLHPHFLFNTLHTISAMMHEDVRGADRMIGTLSHLLRLTLESIGRQEVPLREEIDFLEGYLEIERIRFQDRLALTLEVEPGVLDALVPSMLLQPLAENSIRHGFGTHRGSGAITVRASREGEFLLLTVADNGCGFPGDGHRPARDGFGLAITRRRLEQLYPARHRFELANAASTGGAVVTMAMPFRAASAQLAATPELVLDEDPSTDRRRRTVGAEAHRRTAQG